MSFPSSYYKDLDPILDPFNHMMYIFPIHERLKAAAAAIDTFESYAKFLVAHNMDALPIGQSEAFFESIQAILNYSASVSRFFWPSTYKKNPNFNLHKKRGEFLRDVFAVTDESPLKDRNHRNEIEHFDEKIDIFLNRKNIMGISYPEKIFRDRHNGGLRSHNFRAFYIHENEFEVLGTFFAIEPIIKELRRLLILSAQFYEKRMF